MNEIVPDLSFQDYAGRPGVNSSLVSEILRSPAHGLAYLQERALGDLKPQPHFRIGTLTHHMVLEPSKPFPDLAVKPAGFDGRSKSGKEWMKQNASKMILTEDEWLACVAMGDALLSHPIARQVLEHGDSEASLFADFELEHGQLQRKGRLDRLPYGNTVVDLKTCQNASKAEFERSIWNYGYHRKGAFYLDLANALGLEKTIFILIAVEKSPPYAVAVYQLEQDALARGRIEYQQALRTWHECTVTNSYPGYPAQIERIGLPRWAK